MQEPDFYEVLGVSPKSDDVVIRAAYKAMMLKYHPDTNGASESEARAKAINAAFAILGNPDERRKYDASRATADDTKASPPPPPSPSPDVASASEAGRGPTHTNGEYEPGSWAIGFMLFVAFIGAWIVIGRDNGPQNPEEVSSGAETQASPATVSSTPNGAVDPATNLNQAVPTVGQFVDKIDAAVDDFAATLAKEGMMGAEAYSRNCTAAAIRTNDILETDYCIAFDMSAMVTDLGVSRSLGMPQNQYFRMRAQNLDSDYARFQQASPGRTQLIWIEVNEVLETSVKSAANQSKH